MRGSELAVHAGDTLAAPDCVLKRLAAAPHASAASLMTALEAELVPGNRVELLRDGEQTLPAVFSAIRNAQRFAYLEYYVFEDVQCEGEPLSELLLDAHDRGVQIAIIYDTVGSQSTPSELFHILRRAGIRLLPFNPINPFKARRGWSPNRRDHRKALIVDGSIAIVGGVNLSATYEGALIASARSGSRRWRDTDLRIEGPAVATLQRLFLDHWAHGAPALPDADIPPALPDPGTERVGIIGSIGHRGPSRYYSLLLQVLRSARHLLWITAGYFLPSRAQKDALIDRARRGVDVRLMLPAHIDWTAALSVQRACYAELLQAGVKIYERDSVILHSKSVIVDGSWSAVGSSNFDRRSAQFNDEVDTVVVGAATAAALAELFLADIRQARLIELAAWRRRAWRQRAQELFWKGWERLL